MAQYSDKFNAKIIELLDDLNIQSTIVDVGFFAINRTSCHNCVIYKNLLEDQIINTLLLDIKEAVDNDSAWITWSGKTDDDWFLQVYERN